MKSLSDVSPTLNNQIVDVDASPLSNDSAVECSDTILSDATQKLIPVSSSSSSVPACTLVSNKNKFAGTSSSMLVEDFIDHEPHKQPSSSRNYAKVFNDVGELIGKEIDDYTKYQLVKYPWVPPESYELPFSIKMEKGIETRRYLRQNHLKLYEWVVYSPSKGGLFCKYCPWFVVHHAGGIHKTVALQNLVTQPLKSFKKLTGKDGALTIHDQNLYHRQATEAAQDFLYIYENPGADVSSKVNQQLAEEIRDNRNRLKPIVESIIFLGRQNISFRGHRDNGSLFSKDLENPDVDSDVSNDGNFRSLLRFRVNSGDKTLENHLKNSSSRATYISKTTQNEFISICGTEIKEEILKKVNEAGIYSIGFDETTDESGKSEISLFLRYVYCGKLREDFIGFVDAFEDLVNNKKEEETSYLSDEEEYEAVREEIAAERSRPFHYSQSDELDFELSLTGKALGKIVIKKMKKMNLQMMKCIGISTDECAVMVSEMKGAVKEIQSEAPNALRTSCFNHKLNNSLSSSNKVSQVRNAVGIMKSTVAFFSKHPKRCTVLLTKLGVPLTSLCEHRWVERHEAVQQFVNDLPTIVKVFDKISTWRDMKTASKASCLALALKDSQFILSILTLSDLLALTLPLSRSLQGKSCDLKLASSEVSSVISVLSTRREDSENHFQIVWERAKKLASHLEVDISVPRQCNRQLYKTNYPVQSDIDYYRILIYIPVLDNLLADIRERFPQSVLDVYNLPVFVPDILVLVSEKALHESVEKLCTKFFNILAVMKVDRTVELSVLQAEATMWRQKWLDWQKNNRDKMLPSSALHAMESCSKEVYPLIHNLLQILATLPVSNASAERSFSTLRRLKTWLRTTMLQERLTGLALMCVHRDIELNIDRFAKSKKGKRRLHL